MLQVHYCLQSCDSVLTYYIATAPEYVFVNYHCYNFALQNNQGSSLSSMMDHNQSQVPKVPGMMPAMSYPTSETTRSTLPLEPGSHGGTLPTPCPKSSSHQPNVTASRTLSCSVCGHTFKTKKQLTKHLEQDHDQKRRFKCHLCPKVYTSHYGLKLHVDKHMGKQAYQCDVCGDKFSQKHHYIGHMNTHAGAKPFQCDKCLQCFSYKTNLFAHKKNCAGYFQTS